MEYRNFYNNIIFGINDIFIIKIKSLYGKNSVVLQWTVQEEYFTPEYIAEKCPPVRDMRYVSPTIDYKNPYLLNRQGDILANWHSIKTLPYPLSTFGYSNTTVSLENPNLPSYFSLDGIEEINFADIQLHDELVVKMSNGLLYQFVVTEDIYKKYLSRGKTYLDLSFFDMEYLYANNDNFEPSLRPYINILLGRRK